MTKRFSYLLLMLVAILTGASNAAAQAYVVDFNTQIETNSSQTGDTNRDWKVASGWGHIVDGVEYNYSGAKRYTPYEWQATNGVDGTGCIYAGSQYFADAYGDYEDTYDLLVSPPIEGTVTVQAKRFNAIGSIGFYRVTRSGESLVRGEIIYPIGETSYGITELTNDWVTYTLPAQPAGTRIGIRLQQGYIDNFTAEAVDLNPQPGLGVTLVSPSVSTTIAANEDNTFTVNFVVSVKNTGDLDLTTATEGYSIELRKYNAGGTEPDDHTLVATLPITTNLAKGESLPEDLTISATLNVADYPAAATNGISFRIYENVSHTYASTKTITVIPYEPQFSLRIDNSNFTDGGTVNLGASKEASSKQVIIRSTGGAPLVINSVDVPTGFTTTLIAKTIPALTNDTIEVALDPTVPGAKQGAFVIHTNAGDATINLTGTTVSGNVFFADFESDASLDGLLVEKDGSGYYTYGWIVPYSSYGSSNSVARGYATSSSTPGPFKLILPKLKFEEGDALQFDVQKASSYTDANVTIYYSADRNEWTQLRRMAHDAEREADLLTTTSTTVTLQNIPAGEWYVAFEITYESEIYLDNIIGGQIVDVAHDVALSSTVLPENGTVNSKFVATTKAVNLKDDIAAGSYTARLYFGDEVVKELEAVALPKQQQVAFDFSFTPHAAGTYNARIELAFADGYTTSVSQEVTIAEEVYAALKTVGDGSSSQNASPFNYYYYKTQAENIYTADELAAQGITTGTTITKVAFYGFNTGKQVDYQAKLWISETSQDAFTIDEENSGWNDYYFTTGQENNAPQFDGVATLVSAGTIDNKVSLITFDLATPYVYQGGNLVVQTYGVCDVYPGSGLTYSSQRVSGVKSIVRRRDSGDFSATDYYSENTYRPDIRLGIEAEPNTVSGKVTDKVTGAAMAGVDVKAQNDEVLYGATTDTEGNYSFAILQDNQEYDLVVNKAGYFPHSEKVSVALGSEVRNIELTEAKGFLIESAELPAAGQVNYGYSATATATNYEARDFGAQTYTAELVFGEKVVATAPAVEVKAGETATFNFAFTPHEAGQFQAFVRFTEGENVATSDAIDVTIAEETAGGLVQVGDSTGRENYYPVNFYYNYSCSDIVYTPEMLNASGVVPGSQIQKVIFYVQAESPKTFDYTLTAWAGSVVYDSETYDPSTGHDQLTQVFDHATFTFSAPDASSVNPIRIPIELDLTANPILYDGTNSVRVAIEKQSSTYVGYAYFAQDNKYNTMWAKYNDYSEQLVSTLTKSGNQVQKVPVALFEVAAGATLSGTVKDENSVLVGGATIEARSGEVLYTTTTNEEGQYELDIKQASLTYTVTASAQGYDKATATINLDNEDKTQDFVLYYPTMSDDEAKAQFTIDPADGSKVKSLQTFRLKMNDGTGVQNIDGEDNKATLANTTTGTIYELGITTSGIDGLLFTVSNEPVTELGEYTLTIPAGTLQRTIDYVKFPELVFHFTIEPDPLFATGKYYLQNVGNNMFWGAANDWGTRASLLKHPEYVNLNVIDAAANTYTLESQVSNGGTNYYFGGDYMDGQPVTLTIAQLENGNYTIAQDGNYFGYDGTSTVLGKNLDATAQNAQWQIISEEQMQATLATATQQAPVDATFLIIDPRFGRNNRNVGAWVVSDDCTNKNLTGGNSNKHCAESYHSTFTVQQAIDAPNGIYSLTAQGFYRQDGTDNDNLPAFFINNETAPVPLKTGTENSMADACASFENGLYEAQTIYVEVEDGKINLGVKNEQNANLWVIWDNFVLTYYGADADINDLKFGALLDQLADLRKQAEELKPEVEVAAVTKKLDKALSDTEDVEQNQEAIDEAITILTDAVEAGQASVKAKNVLPKMKELTESTNFYTDAAKDEYYTQWQAKYEAGTLTKSEADALQDPFLVTGWHANITVDNLLLSVWDTNPDFVDAPYYINSWSVEGESDGSEFKVPFFEYWTGDDSSLGERTLTGTIEGLPAGVYNVSAWVRVRAKNGYEAPVYGISMQANDGEAVNVAAGQQVGASQFFLDTFTAQGRVAADGKLALKFQVAADNNVSWLSFKNVKYAFDDVATGIQSIGANGQAEGIYNLNGQKVEKTRKGLYIQNGKKVVVK